MTDHPYKSGAEFNFWRRAVADRDPRAVDPVSHFPFQIAPETKVATAGSCFAQHIARYLQKSGYNYYVAEPGHPILPDTIRAQNNYGLFSARYGNIYTSRQLVQLVDRAYNRYHPAEDVWREADDVFLDPFRPSAQPGGFVSELEMRLDRKQHLAAVRRMLETLDVFIFTLGLTECWVSKTDGAVFPICPGVEGGQFDPAMHQFVNLTVDDVVSDMTRFLMTLARINPNARIVLTVSPVPLAATARQDQHVLTATTYSKSVLRVAADVLAARFDQVAYFPSYEIITGSFSRGAYYAADLRNVVETGVAHVMELFMKHATSQSDSKTVALAASSHEKASTDISAAKSIALAEELVRVECEEAALDRS